MTRLLNNVLTEVLTKSQDLIFSSQMKYFDIRNMVNIIFFVKLR